MKVLLMMILIDHFFVGFIFRFRFVRIAVQPNLWTARTIAWLCANTENVCWRMGLNMIETQWFLDFSSNIRNIFIHFIYIEKKLWYKLCSMKKISFLRIFVTIYMKTILCNVQEPTQCFLYGIVAIEIYMNCVWLNHNYQTP